jgi:hypothetical protein
MNHIEHPDAYAAATKRNIIMNARTTFFRTVADAPQIIEYLDRQPDRNQFAQSLRMALDNYGKLTEKQCQAVRNSMEREVQWKAEYLAKATAAAASQKFVGEVGKKVTLTVTVKKEIMVDRPKFHYYDSGTSNIRLCQDQDGNVIVFSGNAAFPLEGETATITATVKSHRVYSRNGVDTPQTTIIRPKIVA